jgi:hypothetical protein
MLNGTSPPNTNNLGVGPTDEGIINQNGIGNVPGSAIVGKTGSSWNLNK